MTGQAYKGFIMDWYYEWRPYVPVPVRRARALKKLEKLRKKGLDIQPVEINGRKIARTFWGEAWCDHLEKFSDFANRLPRGRTYVRNGSVCHLDIKQGVVKAMVSGSELYNVTVAIKKLPKKKWREVKSRCRGQIGSLLELLQGRLSKSVMAVVTDRDKGLFPLPREIGLECSCPDWAVMCKHVAAALYGVGARLDEKPELLFLLRGVDHEELIKAEADMTVAVTGKAGKRRRIAADEIPDVFDIEMAEERASVAGISMQRRKKTPPARSKAVHPGKMKRARKERGKQRKRTPKRKAKTDKKTNHRRPEAVSGGTSAKTASRVAPSVRAVTGRAVARLRAKFGMSQSRFARLLGVSANTVGKWEKTKDRLNLQVRTRKAWTAVAKLSKQDALQRLNGT